MELKFFVFTFTILVWQGRLLKCNSRIVLYKIGKSYRGLELYRRKPEAVSYYFLRKTLIFAPEMCEYSFQKLCTSRSVKNTYLNNFLGAKSWILFGEITYPNLPTIKRYSHILLVLIQLNSRGNRFSRENPYMLTDIFRTQTQCGNVIYLFVSHHMFWHTLYFRPCQN